MTDLTGAELAAATARAMKRPYMLDELVRGLPNTVTCFSRADGSALAPLARYEWRPDQGGAAAWEVLEWARGQEYDVQIETLGAEGHCASLIDLDSRIMSYRFGPTDAIALCRAVVALGETG